jgi:uncharacterized tellurite resistance protein B-like protein
VVHVLFIEELPLVRVIEDSGISLNREFRTDQPTLEITLSLRSIVTCDPVMSHLYWASILRIMKDHLKLQNKELELLAQAEISKRFLFRRNAYEKAVTVLKAQGFLQDDPTDETTILYVP